MKVIIQTTADGSPTFYREDIDEHYHSVKGALAESHHVYINSGWKQATQSKNHIRVFEVGFGTGLNAALTAQTALESKKTTDYYTHCPTAPPRSIPSRSPTNSGKLSAQ